MTTNDFRTTPLEGRMEQVALIYLIRLHCEWTQASWLVRCFFLLLPLGFFGSMAALLLVTSEDSGWPVIFLVGLPATFFSLMLSMHSKWQFVNPIARLVPGYPIAHISVLALLGIGILGIAPSFIGLGVGANLIGLSAIAIAIAALNLWGLHNNNAFGLLSTVILISSMYPNIAQFWLDPHYQFWVYHLAILVTGWGVAAAWLRRLATLHEERSDYRLPIAGTQFGRVSRPERAEQRKLIARGIKNSSVQSWLVDRSIDQELARPKSSPACLLRQGFTAFSSGSRAALNTLFFGGTTLLFSMILSGSYEIDIARIVEEVPLFLFIFIYIFPGLMLYQFFAARRPLMGAESLRPMTRNEYLSEVIRAGLRDAAIQVATMIGTLFALACCFSPEMISLYSVTVFIAIVTASNLLVTSAAIWFASFRLGSSQSIPPIAVLLSISFVTGGMAFFRSVETDSEAISPRAILIFVGATAGPGLLILRAAKRRWMNAELG